MAFNNVSLVYEYFADPEKSQAISEGDVYIGNPDTDPEIVGNQKQVYHRQEDGTDVPVSQPLQTGAGGVMLVNGSPAQIVVDGNYSLKALDKQGAQKYYDPNRYDGVPITEDDLLSVGLGAVNSMAELRAYPITNLSDNDRIFMSGYYSSGSGGAGVFWWDSASTDADDGGATILPDGHSGPGRWKRIFLDDQANIQMFGAIVDGTTDDTVFNQACADYCETSGKRWTYPAGTTYQGTVTYSNTAPTGLGDTISFVKGMPGKDVFSYKDPSENGWVRPVSITHHGLYVLVDYSVDASVDGNGTYERCDYFGQPIGNVAFAFPGRTDAAITAATPSRVTFENVQVWATGTLANDGNNSSVFYWGVPSYGGFLKKMRWQALSYGWIDGPVSVRYITSVDTTGDTFTFNGDTLADNEIVTLLGEAGTPPGGITARVQLYYVVNSTGNTCQLSLTVGGPAVVLTSTGTGALWLCKASSSYMEYSPDQNTFLHIDSLCRKMGYSLCNHAYSRITDSSAYTPQVGYRFLNYQSLIRSRGANFSAKGHYNEGATDGGFSGESLRLEWDKCDFDAYYLTGANASANVTGNGNIIDYFNTSTNPITIDGIDNEIRFIAQDRSNISIVGLNPSIRFYPDFGGSTRIEVPQNWNEKTALARGSFESDWLETNPSSRYLSKRDLFIPGSQIVGFGTTNGSLTTENDDTTLELNGYARIAESFYASAATFRSRSGNTTKQDIQIGSYLPAAMCRVYIKVRASVAQTETIQLAALDPFSSVGSVVVTHTTDWQVLELFDADLSGLAVDRALQLSLNGLAASATRDIAWIKFVPFAEDKLTYRVKYVAGTYGSLPTAASAGVGSTAFVTDSTTATFAAIVSGGGGNSVPVYSDGSDWRVG